MDELKFKPRSINSCCCFFINWQIFCSQTMKARIGLFGVLGLCCCCCFCGFVVGFFYNPLRTVKKEQRSKNLVGVGLASVWTAQVRHLGLLCMAVTSNLHRIKFKGKWRGHERNSVCTLLWVQKLRYPLTTSPASSCAFCLCFWHFTENTGEVCWGWGRRNWWLPNPEILLFLLI